MLDRRLFVKLGLCAAGSGCARRLPTSRQRCAEPTPEDLAGPFLPMRYQGDADLTRVAGRSERAQGERIVIRGRVVDDRCVAVGGARLELWQANTFGRYDDPRDRSGRRLDPGFQGSALLAADRAGRFSIVTVKPGAYEAPGGTTMRTPHVHFRVSGPGCHDDIFQMYFAGESLNATDENLRLLTESERRRVVIAPEGVAQGARVHDLEVVLRAIDPAAAPDLARFAGRYRLETPGGPVPVTISVTDGKLYAESPPLPRVEARPLSATRFRLKAFGVELEFDADGFAVIENGTRTRARRDPR